MMRRVRESRGASAETYAGHAGISADHYRNYEGGWSDLAAERQKALLSRMGLNQDEVLSEAQKHRHVKETILGPAMRALRKDQGIYRKEAAAAIGVNPEGLRRFERGEVRPVQETIHKYLGLLSCESERDAVRQAKALQPVDKKLVGAALKILRERAGITQEEVGAAIGYSNHALSDLELGHEIHISQKKLRLLPPLFGCENLKQMVRKAGLWAELARETPGADIKR